jgi:phosphotransferase system  glucose/maltose/N-acetylglucosamine-specific IIC component
MYVTACLLTMVGIFAMRWNVVIGGQLFSKSFPGIHHYKVSTSPRAKACWRPSR